MSFGPNRFFAPKQRLRRRLPARNRAVIAMAGRILERASNPQVKREILQIPQPTFGRHAESRNCAVPDARWSFIKRELRLVSGAR